MRVKKLVLLITALTMTVMSTGCWDARDINEKALVTLVLTDRREGEFVFYIEVPNLAAGQGGGGSGGGRGSEQYSIVKGEGSSYADARRNLNSTMEKPVFLGSTRSLIITDALAMYDLEEYMYRLQNMVDYRKTLHIVTTAEKPEDFFSVQPENNVSIGKSIDDTITSLEEDGKVVAYTVSDILEFLYSHYCFVLTNMDLNEGRLAYNGYSIIHKGRYHSFIPLDESKGLVWILGDNIKLLYVVPFDGHTATVEVKTLKRDIKPIYSDGNITFNISFKYNSKVQYMDSDIKFDEKVQTQVKDNLQKQLMEDIALAIEQSKSLRCDYLGFKERFRVAYPDVLQSLDWESAYVDAVFNLSVETGLETAGLMDFEAHGRTIE